MIETIAGAVDRGRARLTAVGIEAAGLEACVLFEHAAGLDRAALLARGREPAESEAAQRFERLLAERSRRVPLAYITGEREFWSLRLRVDRRVLVPRPETETLVEAALDRIGLTIYRLESFMEGDIQEMIDALAAHFQSLALSGGGE